MNVGEFAAMIGARYDCEEYADVLGVGMAEIWDTAAWRNDRTLMLFIASQRGVFESEERARLAYRLITQTRHCGDALDSFIMDGRERRCLNSLMDVPAPMARLAKDIDCDGAMDGCPRKFTLLALRSALEDDLKGAGKYTLLAATAGMEGRPGFRRLQKDVRIAQGRMLAEMRNPFKKKES